MHFIPDIALQVGGTISSIANGVVPFDLYRGRQNVIRSVLEDGLQSQAKEIAQQMGISKPIEVIPCESGGVSARGNALLPGRVGVVFNPEKAKHLNLRERGFVLAREIAHIEQNDTILPIFFATMVGVAVLISASLFFPSMRASFPYSIPFSHAGILAILINRIVYIYLVRSAEMAADGRAFGLSKDKNAGIEFYQKIQIANMRKRDDLQVSWFRGVLRKMVIHKGGDVFSLIRPAISRRIARMEELKKRSIV